MKRSTLILIALVALGAPLLFAQVTSNIAVSANIAEKCTINAGTMAFGTYDPLVTHAAADLDVTGGFTVACSKGSTVTIGFDEGLYEGTGSAPGTPIRRMRGATTSTEFLSYSLFSDASHTTNWNNVGVSYTAADKTAATINIYGRVPQNQDVVVQSYGDTVVATVNY